MDNLKSNAKQMNEGIEINIEELLEMDLEKLLEFIIDLVNNDSENESNSHAIRSSSLTDPTEANKMTIKEAIEHKLGIGIRLTISDILLIQKLRQIVGPTPAYKTKNKTSIQPIGQVNTTFSRKLNTIHQGSSIFQRTKEEIFAQSRPQKQSKV